MFIINDLNTSTLQELIKTASKKYCTSDKKGDHNRKV